MNPATADDRARTLVATLPRTSEQRETSNRPIWVENEHRLKEMMRRARAAAPNAKRLLDIGIGYGYSSAGLRAAFPSATLVGLEHPSRSVICEPAWRAICDHLGISPVAADAFGLPFTDESFEVVFAGEILEHLPPTQLTPGFLDEIRRVLRPGGVAIVSTPNLLSLTNRLIFARGRSPMVPPLPVVGHTFGHIREYSSNEVSALLAAAGFREVSVTTLPRPRTSPDGSRSARLAFLAEAWAGSAWPSLRGFLVASGVRGGMR